MKRKTSEEEKELKAFISDACMRGAWTIKVRSEKQAINLLNRFKKHIYREMWNEVEPFIGLDPRHDGNPPSWSKKCPKCMAVRELKDKYGKIVGR